MVVKPSVAIEEPFAGRIECAEEVFKIVKAVPVHLIPALHLRAMGSELALPGRDGLEKLAGGVPFVKDHDLNILEFLLTWISERGKVPGGNFEGVFESLGFIPKRFFNDVEERAEVPPIGSAGPDGATTVDPKLFEAGKVSDFGFPKSGVVEVDDPVGNAGPSTDLGITLGLVNDGGFPGGSGIGWIKNQRSRELMSSGEEDDGDGVVGILCARFADRSLGAGKSREWIDICSPVVVISVRRNKKFRSGET